MQVPLQVTFEGIQHSDAIEARIREEADKLEQFFGRLISARVVVARPQHRHRKGDIYHIRISSRRSRRRGYRHKPRARRYRGP